MQTSIIVHRGSSQIGGSCVEVRHKGTRLIIDAGLPLEFENEDDAAERPGVKGLFLGDESNPPDALLFSHAHPDHCGLLPQVKSEIPLGMSKGMHALMQALVPFPSGTSLKARKVISLDDGDPLVIGDITLTPFLVDHSGFDARSLQIDCGGRTILYTGDLRGHGRKASALDRMLRRAKSRPDILMMEGTTMGRLPRTGAPASEQELSGELVKLLTGHDGLAFATFSGQDMDRLVSFYKAAIKTNRVLVLDVYGAMILEAFADWSSLPHLGWNNLKVWFPQRVCRWLEHLGLGGKLAEFRQYGISSRQFSKHPGRYVVCFRDSMLDDVRKWPLLDDTILIYSMWSGYLERPGWRKVIDELGMDRVIHLHVSGHANSATLNHIVEELSPQRIVPIHTQSPEAYSKLWDNVHHLMDGEVLEL